MAWYRIGTVAVTNGSKNVTGTGTAWVNNVQPGDAFIGPDGVYNEVDLVGSNTSITLVDNFGGTTASGVAYKIVPTQGRVRDLAAQVAALILDYGSVEAALTVLSGNVGLGKSPNASARLDVAGQVWVDAPSGDATLRLLTSGTEKGKLAVTSAGRGYLESNGAEVLTWLNGNVGIGTATMSAKLDVVGSGDGGMQYRTGTRTVGIGQVASEASVYWGSGTFLSFFSGTVRAYIDTNGQFVQSAPASTAALFINNTVTFSLTSNTNLRISARGSDGVTRVANIPVA